MDRGYRLLLRIPDSANGLASFSANFRYREIDRFTALMKIVFVFTYTLCSWCVNNRLASDLDADFK
jgi:hypothetical protein